MKKIFGLWVFLMALSNLTLAQVDTSYVYKTGQPYGTLDIRIAKSATRYYYINEGSTISYRESTPGVRTNTFRDMTTWNSSAYLQGNFWEKNGSTNYFLMNYRLLLPVSYNATYSQGYPLIIMMHGAGERANCWNTKCYHADRNWNYQRNIPPAPTAANHELLNNDHHLLHGGAPHLDARNLAGARLPNDVNMPTRAFPGFVLYPQNLNGWNANNVQDAIRLLRLIIKKYNIDENRIYIHGLSDGGSAVYEAIKRAPWLFAAALPMSSISDGGIIGASLQTKTSHIPLWIFQGGKDTSPSKGKTEGYIKRFKEAGATVRYSMYSNLGHGVWNTAYKEPDFFSWMLAQDKTDLHVYADNPAICKTNGKGVRFELAEGYFKYQWQRNGVTIAGATSAVYVATTPGTYRARFSRVANPTEAQWNAWSDAVTVTEQNPPQAQMEQIGTVILKDLNNFADAKLKAVGEFAHYYWYKNGTLVDFTGSQDDTTQYATIKAGDCTGPCTSNGAYTVVTAGYDNCPSPPSKPKYLIFNNQAPVNITSPGNFQGQVLSATSVKLTWTDASANETGFEVWRRKKTGTSTFSPWQMVVLTAPNIKLFTDTRLDPGSLYQYKLRGVNNTGRSEYTPAASNQFLEVTTTPDVVDPSTPTNLTAQVTGINTVTLSWQGSTDNTGIREYNIYYGAQTVATKSTATTYVLKNLTVNTNYTFTVKAEDLAGRLSAASNGASVNTAVTGLYYEHSTGAWGDLDEINWSVAEFSGKLSNFSITPRTQEDYFNFKYEGYLTITTGGSYQFRTVSSDGSRIELDGVIVLDNDGLHDSRTASGPLQTLTAGSKRITVRYFEYAGNQNLSVKYKGPDTDELWIDIPQAALTSGGSSALARTSVDTSPGIDQAALTIYPNPAPQHNINVQLSTIDDSPLYIRLMDMTGRPMYEGNFEAYQLREGIQIVPNHTLNNGMYVMVINQNKNIVKKIIAIRN